MFFTASKLFWLVAAPSHLLFFATILALILLLLGQVRAGRVFALIAALLLLLFGILPTHTILMRALENQYRRPAAPAHVDGVVVLGNGERVDIVRTRGTEASGQQDSRMVAAFALARRYPSARVVFSGGSGTLDDNGHHAEADAARFVFDEMGLDPRRLVLERHSRNTAENMAFSRALVRPRPGETWLLATSASHMPRAMAEAARQGWVMTAWPTDFATTPGGYGGYWEVGGNLAQSDWAVHEWIGLLAYRLKG